MKKPPDVISRLLLVMTVTIGGGSMALFAAFLFTGGCTFVNTGSGECGKLTLDTVLCLLFFIQHSAMVRPKFRKHLAKRVSAGYHGAVYAVSSGIALLILMGFWQKSSLSAFTLPPVPALFLRAVFLGMGIPFFLSLRALDTFDALGIKPVVQILKNGKPESDSVPLTVKGPYRWVRHPIYLISIVALWACPHISADRLLLNVLWTVWIVFGAKLEEKDLVARFGEAYVTYQNAVPMIIPFRPKPYSDSGR